MTDVGHASPDLATHRHTRIEYVILCDSAQTTSDGKIYVLGGGWADTFRLVAPENALISPPPNQFAIAASFLIDWMDANRPIGIRVTVEDQDGRGPLFEAKAQLTVGRPPTAAPGDPLRALIAVPVLISFPAAGAYCVRAEMESAPPAEAIRFHVRDAMMPG